MRLLLTFGILLVGMTTFAVTKPSRQEVSSPLIEKVRHAALRANLDPKLALAIVEAESNYNPKATSRVGAQGLMQVMPRTAGQMGVGSSYHILSNATAGCEYFRRLLTEFRSIELALAAYN